MLLSIGGSVGFASGGREGLGRGLVDGLGGSFGVGSLTGGSCKSALIDVDAFGCCWYHVCGGRKFV